MFDYPGGSKLLTPDGHICADYSRFSSPRSSLGEGLSTDCEADVESNLSVVSGDLSGEGHDTRCRNSFTESDWSQGHGENDGKERKGIEWKKISAERKIAFVIALASLLLVLTGFILFSTFDFDCHGDCPGGASSVAKKRQGWTIELNDSFLTNSPQLIHVDGERHQELIIGLRSCRNRSCEAQNKGGCKTPGFGSSSRILGIDSSTGQIKLVRMLPFRLVWMQCSADDSFFRPLCLVAGINGEIASVNMTNSHIVFWKQTCARIFSCQLISNSPKERRRILVCFCLWAEDSSSEYSPVYGLAIYYVSNHEIYSQGALVETDALNDHTLPPPRDLFVMTNNIKGDNASLVVSLEASLGVCSLWMIPYTSIFNQLLHGDELGMLQLQKLLDKVDCALPIIKEDVNQDGITDLVAASKDRSLLIYDGKSKTVDQLFTKDDEEIIGMESTTTPKGTALLLYRRGSSAGCPIHTLEILNFAAGMRSRKLILPGLPVITYADHSKGNFSVFLWLDETMSAPCRDNNNHKAKQTPQHEPNLSDDVVTQTIYRELQDFLSKPLSTPSSPILASHELRSEASRRSITRAFEGERKLAYWRQALQSADPVMSDALRADHLPEAIQTLCLQIIRNLEELLEKHFEKVIENGGWTEVEGEGVDMLLKQIEEGHALTTRAFDLEEEGSKEIGDYSRSEKYGDIYYVVISMILRELGHLKTMSSVTTRLMSDEESLIQQLQNIFQTYPPGTEPAVPTLKQREMDGREDRNIRRSRTLPLSSISVNARETSRTSVGCGIDFRLVQLSTSGNEYRLDDLTDFFMKELQDDSSSTKCPDGHPVAVGSITSDDTNLYITLAPRREDCLTRIVALRKT